MSNRKDKQLRRAATEVVEATKAGDDAHRIIFRLIKAEYRKAPHRQRFGGVAVAKAVVQARIQEMIAAEPLSQDEAGLVDVSRPA